MITKIKKAYKSNPILFVHIAAICMYLLWGMAGRWFVSLFKSEYISQGIQDNAIIVMTLAICFWLVRVSFKRCKYHASDESRFTYYVLWGYSRILGVATTVLTIAYIISIITPVE